MSVERISDEALRQILKGNITESASCVIKFYSNGCHYCHALKDDFLTISQEYKDIHFFAYNIDDISEKALDSIVSINGVPTICFVKTGVKTAISILPDPSSPDPDKFYTMELIKSFIDNKLNLSQESPVASSKSQTLSSASSAFKGGPANIPSDYGGISPIVPTRSGKIKPPKPARKKKIVTKTMRNE